MQIKNNRVDKQYPLKELTGHPMIDVGIDTIAAMQEKPRDELTYEDLKGAADKLFDWYTLDEYKPFRRYLSVIFTNSGFVQPSYNQEKRQEYGKEVLYAFEHDEQATDEDMRCVFFPDLKALDERAYRHHIPLLNGEQVPNFAAKGQPGLPVSGLALLVIHAMPPGCMRVGHLLLFHQIGIPGQPQSTAMNAIIARQNYDKFQKAAAMAGDKITFPYRSPKTRFVDQIAKILMESKKRRQPIVVRNLTGYFWTNYGPGPNIEIYRLDNAVLDFVYAAIQQHEQEWERIIAGAWQEKRGDSDTLEEETKLERRNNFYLRLFDAQTRPRRMIAIMPSSWNLIELFLRKVLNMTTAEVKNYRAIGERLAHYMMDFKQTRQDLSWSFYHQLKDANYGTMRKILREAQEQVSSKGQTEILVTVEQFVQAFEQSSDPYHFFLARDLIVMSMFETLTNAGYNMAGNTPDDE